MIAKDQPKRELWTVGGHVYRSEPVQTLDGREGFLLLDADDPRWDEVWTLTESQPDEERKEV